MITKIQGSNTKHKIETVVTRGMLFWMIIITCLFIWLIQGNSDPIFQFGPNSQLFILSISIDTPNKYLMVVAFCIINSCIRVLNHSILGVYIMNIIQDKTKTPAYNSYEITLINSVFSWFDFFMFVNIIFAQFDMFLIEVCSDLIVTAIVTSYYLTYKNKIEQVHIVQDNVEIIIDK